MPGTSGFLLSDRDKMNEIVRAGCEGLFTFR